jgi:hypothetical protein
LKEWKPMQQPLITSPKINIKLIKVVKKNRPTSTSDTPSAILPRCFKPQNLKMLAMEPLSLCKRSDTIFSPKVKTRHEATFELANIQLQESRKEIYFSENRVERDKS